MTKEDVWQLTLPQLSGYMKNINKWLEFEVELKTMSLGGLFGGSSGSADDEHEATEEDINMLESFLAGMI